MPLAPIRRSVHPFEHLCRSLTDTGSPGDQANPNIAWQRIDKVAIPDRVPCCPFQVATPNQVEIVCGASLDQFGTDRSDPCDVSDSITAMDRNDPCREVAHVDASQAGFLHHRFQGGLIGMLADRLSQIAVAGFVTSNQLADARQH